MIVAAGNVEEIQERVRGTSPGTRLLPVAGASKPGLSSSRREDVERLDLSALSGIVEYDPAELTITALAGTPVRDIQAALAQHGQYLPFDPPLADAGATLGGTVAAGLSGAAALRHGRVRDFIIGVKFVDGNGRLISGGGKVVKNAAGFDLPKLMVGSIGRLGVMVQLSFKVFPQPPATATLQFSLANTGSAMTAAGALAMNPVELEAMDISGGELFVRIGGRAQTLDRRLERLQTALGLVAVRHDGADELALWRAAGEFDWVPDSNALVRVPLTAAQVDRLDTALAAVPGLQARYALGGTVAWISWPADAPLDLLGALLSVQDLRGMVLTGTRDSAILGPATGGAFAQRIARALDPHSRFLEL